MAVQAVILAAGQGKRMYSRLPKVLHPLAGEPLLQHVLKTARLVATETTPIVMVGHEREVVQAAFSDQTITWVHQAEQLGTAHAVQQALPFIADDAGVLVLYGDVPLISPDTLQRLIDQTPLYSIGLLTAHLHMPTGYGRIRRDEHRHIVSIVEEKDATVEEKKITEINTGIYYVPATLLRQWLPTIKNNNAQNEYYLTDIIALAASNKVPVYSTEPNDPEEILGVNDRLQLSHLERIYQMQMAKQFMRAGVTLKDPARFDVRGEVRMGRDVTIDVNVILEGKVVIGNDCVIGAHTFLRNVVLGDRVEIKSHTVIDGADIADDSVIGPFARLRPGTELASHTHIGNFVEIKNSEIGEYSKVNHLSYLGDSKVGARVNVGAGTITCNYDGANKHQTVIGDDVHIGSDTQLVAPVNIGAGATIAAGSTITKDAPANQLTLTQTLSQRSLKWMRPTKKERV